MDQQKASLGVERNISTASISPSNQQSQPLSPYKQELLNWKFWAAAQEDNVDEINLLLNQGADINFMKTISPLMTASFWGNENVVKLLLEKGANPNLKDKDGKTAKDYAAQRGHTTIVKLLSDGPNSTVSALLNKIRFSGTMRSNEGHLELYYQKWSNKAKKIDGQIMVILKGFESNSTPLWEFTTSPLINALTFQGFTVYSFDYRGSGNSEGKRGSVKDWNSEIRDDVHKFLDFIIMPNKSQVYFLAKEVGALVFLDYVLNYSNPFPEIQGVIFLNPRIAFKFSSFRKKTKSKSLALLIPSKKMKSSDAKELEAMEEKPTYGFYTELVNVSQQVQKQLASFKIPMLVIVDYQESVPSPKSSSGELLRGWAYFQRFTSCPNKQLVIVEKTTPTSSLAEMEVWLEGIVVNHRDLGTADIQQRQSILSILPIEIIHEIAHHLSHRDRQHFSQTCKLYYKLMRMYEDKPVHKPKNKAVLSDIKDDKTLKRFLKSVKNPESLQSIVIQNALITRKGISFLVQQNLSSLEELHFNELDSLLDGSLATICDHLSGLKKLNLFGCRGITDHGMVHLNKLRKLNDFTLTNNRFITNRACMYIAHVKKVHLGGTLIGRGLGYLTHAEDLNVWGCSAIEDSMLSLLTPSLTKLNLRCCHYLSDGLFPFMTHLFALKSLNLRSGCKKQFKFFATSLTYLPQLEELDISGCTFVHFSSPQAYQALGRLKNLQIGSTLINDQIVACLTGVEKLDLPCCHRITNNSIQLLTGLSSLNLWCCYKSTHIDDRSLYYLRNVPELVLNGCTRLSNLGLAHLTNVQNLSIAHCHLITNNGMKHLSNLHYLNLRGLGVTSEGIRYLYRLQSLNLTDCPNIDDECLKYLTGLQTLYLGNNPKVTDAALKNLSTIITVKNLTNDA